MQVFRINWLTQTDFLGTAVYESEEELSESDSSTLRCLPLNILANQSWQPLAFTQRLGTELRICTKNLLETLLPLRSERLNVTV